MGMTMYGIACGYPYIVIPISINMIHPESRKRRSAAPGEERPERTMEGGKAIQS
jgi:hypothetical protein